MNQERLLKIILTPIVSEKASMASANNNQYSFKVIKDATKKEIKAAIELLFNVNVKEVQTLNIKGKKKIFARKVGNRASWKKAIVRIAEGQMIDVTA